MIARDLRLNDILIKDGDPIVDLESDLVNRLTKSPDLAKIMYSAVINNYQWSFLNTDNVEQFKGWFNTYWERAIIKHLPLFEKQLDFAKNIDKAKVEDIDITHTTTEKPELTDTSTHKLGETNTTDYGRSLTMTVNNKEQESSQQFEQQLVHTERQLQSEGNKNTYSGTDTYTRGGTNTLTLERTGTKTITVLDKGTNTVSQYNAENFMKIIESTSILDNFIDEFYPLFQSVEFWI